MRSVSQRPNMRHVCESQVERKACSKQWVLRNVCDYEQVRRPDGSEFRLLVNSPKGD